MKAGRIAKLKSYLNEPFYYGRCIRWMIETGSGSNIRCDRCGNTANAVMTVQRSQGTYYIPLCKKHFGETFPDTEYVPTSKEYIKPARKPKPILSVGSKVRWRHYAGMPSMQGEIVEFKPDGLIRVTAGNGFAEIMAGLVQAV